MPVSVRVALAFLPMSAYFFAIGLWRGGPRPRVVSGSLDFGLLAFGLGGLIAFGPVGQMVVGLVFPRPGVSAWMAVASLLALLALIRVRRFRTRLVVYNVDPPALIEALGLAMTTSSGPPRRTVLGFEDASSSRGVTLDLNRSRVAVLDAHGDDPESLIDALRPSLALALSSVPPRPSRLSWIWFALSTISAAIPAVVVLLSRDEVRAALKRLRGG